MRFCVCSVYLSLLLAPNVTAKSKVNLIAITSKSEKSDKKISIAIVGGAIS